MPEKKFKPFTLKVKVNNLDELIALFLLSNSNYTTGNFINTHPHKDQYFKEHQFKNRNVNPIGSSFTLLDNKLKENNINI